MKKGLVLEGGAMRGLFTAGVLDVFMEEGIEFDGAVGTSAGALFGSNLKSRQMKRALRYNMKYCNDDRYGSFKNLLKTGDYFDKEFDYDEIPNRLDPFDVKTYRENPMEFYVTCTDIEDGSSVYYNAKNGDAHDIEWMRAGASMPIFSKIVEIDGFKLLDGGITDSVPIIFMEQMGYDRNVVILTQPEGYVKKAPKLLPVMKALYRKYPEAYRAMKERHIIYNDTIEYIKEKEESGEIFVIRPEEALGISRIERDPNELLRVCKEGRKVAKRLLPELKEFLSCIK